MNFRDKSMGGLYALALAAVFALALAGCGGGGGTATPTTMPGPQMACEDAGGRWHDDDTCTSAAELAAERMAAQREAISDAIMEAITAVDAVDNDSTDAEVSAADMAVADARSAIAAAANVPDEEKAANTGTVDLLASQLADAKADRMAHMDDARKAAAAAMMATAMKLHAGIGSDPLADSGAGRRTAAYSGANDADITVTIGANAQALKENKDATVPANHGWEGRKYTGGTSEAIVFSNVGEPTEGAKFNARHTLATADTDATKAGELTIATAGDTDVQSRVASPRFDQSAGTKTFKLPANTVRVVIPGSYHGVSGTYYCTPGSGQTCSAAVAAKGFTLAGGSWAFKPTDPETRLMDVPDADYASYGGWLHIAANGTWAASAFADYKGGDGSAENASGIDTLHGTARYMGGAAGMYALYSATGGTNDAGTFTARATLEADFSDNSITGAIDRFMGADGQSRNWSVELKEAAVAATGGISRTADNDTVWTIDGTAAASSGEWSGRLYENGDDGVPKVATGTFHSMFSTDGKMVGGFGVNRQ